MSGQSARASLTGMALPMPNSLASREHCDNAGAVRANERHHADRQAAQFRAHRLLHRGEEAVEVEIQALDLLRSAHADVLQV